MESDGTWLRAEGSGEDLAARISGMTLLSQPLVWVGNKPPGGAENAALWAEVQRMAKEGVAASVPRLEQFIAEHRDSAWVPSLRANLGRYYRERGQYSRALAH